MDVQETFLKEKLTRDKVTFARISPSNWTADVAASLGPFTPPVGSNAKGCQ